MKYIFDPMSSVNQGVAGFEVIPKGDSAELVEVLISAC